MLRITAIWFFGLLASAIFGGMVGGRMGYYSDGVFFGVIGGMCVFACARLLARKTETGHYEFQTRPLGVKTGQYPDTEKNILRTENK